MRTEAGARSVILPAQSILEESSTQKHRIGERLRLSDGRVFYYAKAGGALVAGQCAIAALHTANHHNMAPAAAVAVGSKTVTITLGATAVTAGMYTDGLMAIIAGGGIGNTYQIESHNTADASGVLTVQLRNEVAVALVVATSKIDLAPNLYNGITDSTDEEHLHAGVPLIAVTSAYYAWIQTWGLCAVRSGDTAAAGVLLSADSAAGERKAMADYVKSIIGESYGEAAADGEYNLCYLRICP